MSRIAIVALAYAMIYTLEWFDPPVAEYYFYAAVSSFLLILLCVWTEDLINLGYASTQLICMYLYLCKISPSATWVNSVLYDPIVSASEYVYYYELIMLHTGLLNVLFIFVGNANTASVSDKVSSDNSDKSNIELEEVST